MAKMIARTTYNSCKSNLEGVCTHVNVFVEEAGQLFEEMLDLHPTCYSLLHNMYT